MKTKTVKAKTLKVGDEIVCEVMSLLGGHLLQAGTSHQFTAGFDSDDDVEVLDEVTDEDANGEG